MMESMGTHINELDRLTKLLLLSWCAKFRAIDIRAIYKSAAEILLVKSKKYGPYSASQTP